MNVSSTLENRSCLEASLIARADKLVNQLFENKQYSDPLSIRESTILKMLAKGLTAEQISMVIGCGMCTTRSHLQRIYTKLDAKSSIQAVVIGRSLGLLDN
jgi:LuxR family transcriptional regulator, maltose regulon positive regulatory protein